MALTAVLTQVALQAAAALAGFGWAVPIRPAAPAEVAPAPAPAGAAPTPAAPPGPAPGGPVAPPPAAVPAPPAAVPAPPAPASPPAAPARSPAFPASAVRALRPIRNVVTRDPAVAITFDACATRSHHYTFDRQLFEVVKRERVPATIFVSGRWVEAHPEVMAELAADPLVEFGDHSYEHPHMAHLPVARIVAEIDQTEAALAKYGKRSVAFRPPFGEWSSRLVYVVQDLQLPTVTWDVVSGDPSARTTVDGMVRNVVGKTRAGSIIIFHINGRGHKTAQALPVILRDLRERGFRFVQLSELMASGGAAPARTAPVAPIPLAPISAGPASADPIPAAGLPITAIPAASVPLQPPPAPGPQ
jgi:peptidoglycan-N-acetylglucosamine deacetylase